MNRPTRRQAIKYLIGGAAAAACPFPAAMPAADRSPAGALPAGEPPAKLGSESNVICHEVRDGAHFDLPKPSAEYDVVIVGGGPSGLCSAYRLRNTNFLLLEKEPRLGGNAISEQWNGKWYSTGAAYSGDEALEKLCVEIGMEIHRIRSVDAAIIDDQLVPEFWTEGLWKSPYPESVKRNFAQFQKDMKAIDFEKSAEKLDSMTFAELLKLYGPELKLWFDNFGPNNWGADTENTSALIGAQTVEWGGGLEPNRFTWPGGMGRISLALEAAIEKAAPGRIRKSATVVQVETDGEKARVGYFDRGELVTAAAKTVIVACPKFIGKRIIKGLPAEQFQAMKAVRYAPYLVVNVCSRQVIYNGSYDTNVPAPSPIVDFNVADWVESRDNRDVNRPAVLTCYVPRPESDRLRILSDEYVLGFGPRVVDLVNTWFPGARDKVEEVHIYRRGHPMFLAAPGMLTRLAPKIRQPFHNIFMAHSDSQGGISEYGGALAAAERVSREAMSSLELTSRRAHVFTPSSLSRFV
ncbi:MAG TPA: FAD-dependent oxidoreductase [Terriglobia bacterium]|nr:FAD-dependent oxidoreductase [Terriglobia bacterium]